MDRDNRKSHLAPQLSPATKELLRSSDSPTYLTQTDQTPTSGETPNSGAMASHRDQSSSVPSRPPARRGSGQLGRSSGPAVHPGLGPRVTIANSIPEPRPPVRMSSQRGERGLGRTGLRGPNTAVFSLPTRPAPPSGPVPPPPPRGLVTAEELKRAHHHHHHHHQAAVQLSPNRPS